jgi:hypothetical protein
VDVVDVHEDLGFGARVDLGHGVLIPRVFPPLRSVDRDGVGRPDLGLLVVAGRVAGLRFLDPELRGSREGLPLGMDR